MKRLLLGAALALCGCTHTLTLYEPGFASELEDPDAPELVVHVASGHFVADEPESDGVYMLLPPLAERAQPADWAVPVPPRLAAPVCFDVLPPEAAERGAMWQVDAGHPLNLVVPADGAVDLGAALGLAPVRLEVTPAPNLGIRLVPTAAMGGDPRAEGMEIGNQGVLVFRSAQDPLRGTIVVYWLR